MGETEYQAKAVVLALGAMSRMLGMGEERLLGRGYQPARFATRLFF